MGTHREEDTLPRGKRRAGECPARAPEGPGGSPGLSEGGAVGYRLRFGGASTGHTLISSLPARTVSNGPGNGLALSRRLPR